MRCFVLTMRCFVSLLLMHISAVQGLAFSNTPFDALLDRRTVLAGAAFATAATPSFASAAASTTSPSLATRLDQDILTLPPSGGPVSNELKGIDNLYFPEFLAGTWQVTQTLVDTKTPLGLKYVGGPKGDESIAQASMAEARQQLNKPVSLQLRFLTTKFGVAEDRLFNAAARLNAFAGKTVVASVEYNDVAASNRNAVLQKGGTPTDPLQTFVVRFKGPAAQKTFVLSHDAQSMSETEWAGREVVRSIFALTNQNTAPPLTTDSELIYSFAKKDDNHVQGRLRIAGYLNAQSDVLYFDARNRAVSLQDYTLDMVRVA